MQQTLWLGFCLIAVVCGCGESGVVNMDKDKGGWDEYEGHDIPVWISGTARELDTFYEKHTLGDIHRQEVSHASERVMLIQTFPYSGVPDSHIYVYRKHDDRWGFVSFHYVSSLENARLAVGRASEDFDLIVDAVVIASFPLEPTSFDE